MAGFYLLVSRGDKCILDHLRVVSSWIGKGVGRSLFAHARARAAAISARRMELEADPHAVGFYRHMGARHLRNTTTELEGVLPLMDIEIASDEGERVRASIEEPRGN